MMIWSFGACLLLGTRASQWIPTDRTPVIKRHNRPLQAASGEAVQILLWKKNLELPAVFNDTFASGCPVQCRVSNDRSMLPKAHVVVFNEERDRHTVSSMQPWQAVAIFVLTSIMSYIDPLSELADANLFLSFSASADIKVDRSFALLQPPLNVSDGFGREMDVEGLWWEGQLCGITPPDMAGRDKGVAVFMNDCQSLDSIFAHRYLTELYKHLPIDAYGSCLNNMGTSINPKDPVQVLAKMRQYRVVIVWEDTVAQDYITEQIYWALAAGAIPAYLGAPNVSGKLPAKDSFIDISMYPDPHALSAELHRVLGDDQAFNQYHQWRLREWAPGIDAEWSALRRGEHSFPCRICKWYSRRSQV